MCEPRLRALTSVHEERGAMLETSSSVPEPRWRAAWLAVLVVPAFAIAALALVGAVAAASPPAHQRPEVERAEPLEPAAPAGLQARVVELEVASEALAEQLARARRELSEL
jgi:hypothetical protein